jgi:hypothetical protein
MTKNMHDWFFMRDGFTSFRLDPERDRAYLFGKLDRNRRDALLDGIEEACYGLRGYKGVMYGDYGRGKTHQCQNLVYECAHRDLPVKPVYVKCTEYGAKEPFSSLFYPMILGLGAAEIHRVAQAYEKRVEAKQADPIVSVIGEGDVARVFLSLQLNNFELVLLAMKWLGGTKLDGKTLEKLGAALSPQITVSRDFASVMKGLAHMFLEVDQRVLLFLIDEADLFKGVTNADSTQKWVSSLRSLTEITPVGYIFFVGANNEDEIPQMLVWDEVRTRIGAANYRDLPNPGDAAMRQWIAEFFQTFVLKGNAPESHRAALAEAANITDVPVELRNIVGDDAGAIAAFPFTPEALDDFIVHSVTDVFANKPREILDRIDRAAARAMRLNQHRIDSAVLAAIRGESTEEL